MDMAMRQPQRMAEFWGRFSPRFTVKIRDLTELPDMKTGEGAYE
jgi:hypothetical protein